MGKATTSEQTRLVSLILDFDWSKMFSEKSEFVFPELVAGSGEQDFSKCLVLDHSK